MKWVVVLFLALLCLAVCSTLAEVSVEEGGGEAITDQEVTTEDEANANEDRAVAEDEETSTTEVENVSDSSTKRDPPAQQGEEGKVQDALNEPTEESTATEGDLEDEESESGRGESAASGETAHQSMWSILDNSYYSVVIDVQEAIGVLLARIARSEKGRDTTDASGMIEDEDSGEMGFISDDAVVELDEEPIVIQGDGLSYRCVLQRADPPEQYPCWELEDFFDRVFSGLCLHYLVRKATAYGEGMASQWRDAHLRIRTRIAFLNGVITLLGFCLTPSTWMVVLAL